MFVLSERSEALLVFFLRNLTGRTGATQLLEPKGLTRR